MRFEELDTDTVSGLGTEPNVARAEQLVNNNKVLYRYRVSDRLEAVVLDNDELIPVTVSIEDGKLQNTCACPQKEEYWCSYALAVLLAWINAPESFLSRTSLKERLKQYSRNELIKIILDLADRVLDVREILKQENPDLDDILESIDQIIAEAVAGGPKSIDQIEDKLRQAQAKADRLAQSGRLSEARAIYFYILDNIFGLEEDHGQVGVLSQDLKRELFEEYCQFIHEDRNLDYQLVQQEIEQLESRPQESIGQLDFTEIKRMLAEKA
jgi:uncharacterized Zn finger protein